MWPPDKVNESMDSGPIDNQMAKVTIRGLIRDRVVMSTADTERTLMPNTYVRLLTQEFEDFSIIAEGTGIVPEELAEYAHPITVRQHLQCIENVLPLRRSPDWHLQWGKRMAENFHGVVTLAWLTAPSLGEGLDAFIKYMPYRVPYLDWNGSSDGDSFRCVVTPLIDLGPVRQMLTEVPLIVMHEYVRVVRHGPATEARIELTYPPPLYRDLYANWFDCPVDFECAGTALVIPTKWRRVTNVDFDESTWQTSLARCEALCRVSEDRDALSSVRELLFQALEQPTVRTLPTLDTVAQQMHLSPRTVIRRLRAMGSTFQQVSDEVLKQRARELLANQQTRVHEVATRLGYSDVASFRKAFKRWYGTSPGKYRERYLTRVD
ncbi:MAG: AraC-like DNA-binding protein [Gammaproteobacteria bacterium]